MYEGNQCRAPLIIWHAHPLRQVNSCLDAQMSGVSAQNNVPASSSGSPSESPPAGIRPSPRLTWKSESNKAVGDEQANGLVHREHWGTPQGV